MNSNSVFEGKTILLVNTGSLKKKFILKKLKSLGLIIVVLNKEKNWAQSYVDHWVLTDNNDHSRALDDLDSFLNNNPQIRIDGVITFWEDDVLLTSKITDKYRLVGIPFKVAKKARNKFLFREFCQKNGIQFPNYGIVKNLKDLESLSLNLKFPVVLKPTSGSSSAFVIKAQDKEELLNVYDYVSKNISLNTETALHEGLDILVEEYIDGDEVDVDILLQNGKIKFYSITDNHQTKEPFFIETGWSIPSSLPDKDQLSLLGLAEKTLEKMGVQNGCVHFEAKATKHGAVPIEVNLRMGGDESYIFIKEAWHVDMIEQAVMISLGIYFEKIIKPENPYKYLASCDFVPEDSGILVKFHIDEKLKQNKNLKELHLFKEIGDPVLVPPEGYEYMGWVIATGNNSLDAKDNLNEIVKKISYEVVKFNPLSSIGKTERKDNFSLAAINKDLLKKAAKIEHIRHLAIEDKKKLHIGIACNDFSSDRSTVEGELSSVGFNIQKNLQERGYKVSFFDFNNINKVFHDLQNSDIDLVFNVCERINNSSLLEPHAASLLDILQIPYTGSNPFTLSLCIDKIKVKKLLTYHGIPTPKWDYAYSLNDEIDEKLRYPLIVKPANTDNSIGITNDSVVINKQQLKQQLHKVIVDLGCPALVEEYIEGDEYDVSILGSEYDDLRVLPLSRSIFDNLPKDYWHIFTHSAKYGSESVYAEGEGSAYDNIIVQRPPKNVNKKLLSLITEIALDTYNILDCHDYGRVEVKIDKDNNPYVLELNPNPAINHDMCLPSVAKLTGMNYGDFLEEIINMAIKRYKDRPPYYHLQTNLYSTII